MSCNLAFPDLPESLVIDLQALVVSYRGNDDVGQVPGLYQSRQPGSQVHRFAKQLHRRVDIFALNIVVGRERRVSCLYARVIFHELALVEHCVHPVQDRLLGATVLGERQGHELSAVLHRPG